MHHTEAALLMRMMSIGGILDAKAHTIQLVSDTENRHSPAAVANAERMVATVYKSHLPLMEKLLGDLRRP